MSEIDIVDRLRIVWTSMTDMGNAERAEAADEIERLRAERDEARREVCWNEADTTEDRIEYARQRGWDCFKKDRK